MPTPWLSRRVIPAAICGVLSSSTLLAQDAPKAPPAGGDAKPAAAAADPFAIPEGADAQVIQNFLQQLVKTQPEKRTLEGRREHVRKVEGVVAKVLEKDLDEQTALMATDARFQLLRFLEATGDPNAAADREKFLEALAKNKLPRLAERGKLFQLASRVSQVGAADAKARLKLIDDIAAFIKEGDLTQERVELATTPPDILAQLGDTETATKALEAFAKAFESRKDERLADLIEQLRASGRRYGLVGNSMVLKGKSLDGKDFNIDDLKGKVVLVDYWATWCRPCIQEMPHVRHLYEAYHDKGFEVVGISLDEKKEVLQAFLESEKLPWVQLYPEGGAGTWDNPFAKYYGISSIPTAILINREGKVVSLDAIGPELDKQLEKLLGPAPVKSEKPEAKPN